MQFDKHGRELPDNTPLALPAGFTPPETLAEQIQRLVRTNVSAAAVQDGAESFEDADDFDIPDDDEQDPTSMFELEFDPVLGREVTADQILNDPKLKQEYAQLQSEQDASEQHKPEEGASGSPTEKDPETPLPLQDSNPT